MERPSGHDLMASIGSVPQNVPRSPGDGFRPGQTAPPASSQGGKVKTSGGGVRSVNMRHTLHSELLKPAQGRMTGRRPVTNSAKPSNSTRSSGTTYRRQGSTAKGAAGASKKTAPPRPTPRPFPMSLPQIRSPSPPNPSSPCGNSEHDADEPTPPGSPYASPSPRPSSPKQGGCDPLLD